MEEFKKLLILTAMVELIRRGQNLENIAAYSHGIAKGIIRRMKEDIKEEEIIDL